MKKQNRKLKFKLVIQSFVPLFLLILIKYFDYHVITSVTLFIKKLLYGDFGILLRMWTNQYFGVLWVSLFSILWIISGMISLWQFKDVHFSGFVDAGDKVAIEEELTESGVLFFMTFVFPLLLDDITTLRGFMLFSGTLILIILLMLKTNLYYQNPILTILGYKVYRVRFLNKPCNVENKMYVAICKEKLNETKIVKWKYVSDDVVLIYNKNS